MMILIGLDEFRQSTERDLTLWRLLVARWVLNAYTEAMLWLAHRGACPEWVIALYERGEDRHLLGRNYARARGWIV